MSPAAIINAAELDSLGPGDLRPDSARGNVEVPLLPLRQALLAVKPHAAGPKGPPEMQTVRILPGADHCHVVATDQYTVALAAVPVSDISMTELDPIDLHVDDVAKVLAVFKMPSDKDLWPSCSVRLTPRGNDVSVTDAGGLFDGQELVVPAPTLTSFPDLPTLLGKQLASARRLAYPPSTDRGLPGSAVVKLATAVKTYDEPAYVQATSADAKSSFLVLVGDRFISLVTSATPENFVGEDSDWSPTRWREAWAQALPRSAS